MQQAKSSLTTAESSSELVRILKVGVSLGFRMDWPIDVRGISTQLQVLPTWSFVKGERHVFKRECREFIHPQSVWGYNTEDLLASDSLEEHAQFLLAKFEPALPAIQQYLHHPEVDVRVHFLFRIAGTNGSYSLAPVTLGRLSTICNRITSVFVSMPQDYYDPI